jgi:hypothetical protein
MLSVPQFFPSSQSAGFTKSSIESWMPALASGSSRSPSSCRAATASITMALPRSAMRSLIRVTSSSENRYSSRRLCLAEMYHHRWVERCLTGRAGKAKEKLHVRIFSSLLYGLLVSGCPSPTCYRKAYGNPRLKAARYGVSGTTAALSSCSNCRLP